jgi:hypothetical protein
LEHNSKYVVDFPWDDDKLIVTCKLKSRATFLLFYWDTRWVAVIADERDQLCSVDQFWALFGDWSLPERKDRCYSFVIGDSDGLLYFCVS